MTDRHPALDEPPEARLAYVQVVAGLAAADGQVSDAELDALRRLAAQLGLSDADVDTVVEFALSPTPRPVRDALHSLASSSLRFTVVTDLVVLGFADGRYDIQERKQVKGLAAVMGVDDAQVTEIEQFVMAQREEEAHSERRQRKRAAKRDEEEAAPPWPARLAAVGVPLAAMLAVTPLDEGALVAVTQGLAALGGGMGTIPGFGVALGLGVGSFVGVRELHRRLSQRKSDDDR